MSTVVNLRYAVNSWLAATSAEFPEAVGDEGGEDEGGEEGNGPVAAKEVEEDEGENGKPDETSYDHLPDGIGLLELLGDLFGFGGVGVEFCLGGLPVFDGFVVLGTSGVEAT